MTVHKGTFILLAEKETMTLEKIKSSKHSLSFVVFFIAKCVSC